MGESITIGLRKKTKRSLIKRKDTKDTQTPSAIYMWSTAPSPSAQGPRGAPGVVSLNVQSRVSSTNRSPECSSGIAFAGTSKGACLHVRSVIRRSSSEFQIFMLETSTKSRQSLMLFTVHFDGFISP